MLLFEIATETVGSQYLQGAEEYEVTQLAKEIITVLRRKGGTFTADDVTSAFHGEHRRLMQGCEGS